MPTRMKDIAADLGVSVVTVSKVLRNHADISTETRQRVLKRIKEMNYEPNPAARALATGRSCLIGLVVPNLTHPFFAEIAKSGSKVLRKHGYSFLMASSDEGPKFEKEEIRQLLARRVDALIIASTQSPDEFLEQLQKTKTPYLLLDRKIDGSRAPFVGIDDTKAGELATNHLIELGRQHIACIAGKDTSTALGRLEGFRKALMTHGLKIPEGHIAFRSRTDNDAHVTGYKAMKSLLGLRPRPDGVFCFNDPVAMGAMQAILDAGLKIPEEIALVGCGNLWFAPMLRVPLSSIDQQCQRMGEKAAAIALDMIAGKSNNAKNVLFEPKLVARQSTLGNGAI